MTLRALFEALESGATAAAWADFARAMTASEIAALRGARVVKGAPALTAWPCDEAGARCGREVLESTPGAPHAFVAVCEGTCEREDRCADVALSAEELARVRIDRRELARVLRALYRVDGPATTFATTAPPPIEPVRLGEERTEARTRDVFVALSPAGAGIAAFVDARTRVTRPTLVLVATARAIDAALAARHAPGAHVEIEALEDAIVARDDALVRAPRLRLVAPLAEPVRAESGYEARGAEDAGDEDLGPVRAGGIAAQLGARQFADLAIRVVDGHTVRISHKRRRVRATYIDLGLATKTRAPSSTWHLLLDVCAGHGKFRWKKYGSMNNAKVKVSRLQAALRAAIGLDDRPFHAFRVVDGWRAKFFASSEIAEEHE